MICRQNAIVAVYTWAINDYKFHKNLCFFYWICFFFLGCFHDSVLSNITRKANLSIFRKSVGICQEMCQRHNTTVFAVKVNSNFNYNVRTCWYLFICVCKKGNFRAVIIFKANNCICIEDVGAMFLSESVDPKNCNSGCFLVRKDIYENECGGDSSYNVFEFELNTGIGNFKYTL